MQKLLGYVPRCLGYSPLSNALSLPFSGSLSHAPALWICLNVLVIRIVRVEIACRLQDSSFGTELDHFEGERYISLGAALALIPPSRHVAQRWAGGMFSDACALVHAIHGHV